jgi:hypothetical protein
VRHVGYNNPELRRRKLRRDRGILESKLAEEQGDRAEAVRQWSAILAALPGDAESLGALNRLGRQPAVAEGRL